MTSLRRALRIRTPGGTGTVTYAAPGVLDPALAGKPWALMDGDDRARPFDASSAVVLCSRCEEPLHQGACVVAEVVLLRAEVRRLKGEVE